MANSKLMELMSVIQSSLICNAGTLIVISINRENRNNVERQKNVLFDK
jgi:hypothetical protein